MDPAIVDLGLDEGTYLKQGGSIRSWSYYSRYTVAADTTVTTIFTTALGGGSGFTRVDQTNMPAPGQIPNSQRFDAKFLAAGYCGGAAKSDANTIAIMKWLFTTVIQIVIQDKVPQLQKRISDLLGIGLALFNDPTTAAEPVNQTLRTDLAKGMVLQRPIKIAANVNFSIVIAPGVAAAAQQVTDGDFLDISLTGDLWSRAG